MITIMHTCHDDNSYYQNNVCIRVYVATIIITPRGKVIGRVVVVVVVVVVVSRKITISGGLGT